MMNILKYTADNALHFEGNRGDTYMKWLQEDSAKQSKEASNFFDEWYKRTFPDMAQANEAFDVIMSMLSADKQLAFEHGMKAGAWLIMELFQVSE